MSQPLTAAAPPWPAPPFDVERLRRDFPQLAARSGGKPLFYLDNAATSQKPRAVLEATERYYREECSNVHRGVYGRRRRSSSPAAPPSPSTWSPRPLPGAA